MYGWLYINGTPIYGDQTIGTYNKCTVNENNLVNHWIEVYQHYSKKKEREDDRQNESRTLVAF